MYGIRSRCGKVAVGVVDGSVFDVLFVFYRGMCAVVDISVGMRVFCVWWKRDQL